MPPIQVLPFSGMYVSVLENEIVVGWCTKKIVFDENEKNYQAPKTNDYFLIVDKPVKEGHDVLLK
jgi:hypothetical protein